MTDEEKRVGVFMRDIAAKVTTVVQCLRETADGPADAALIALTAARVILQAHEHVCEDLKYFIDMSEAIARALVHVSIPLADVMKPGAHA